MIPDRVGEAEAYRRSLLAALGEDDPAVAQAATPALLRELITAADQGVRTVPAAG